MQASKLIILTPGFPGTETETFCLPAIQQFVLSLARLKGNENVIVVSTQYPFIKKTYLWNQIQVRAAGGRNRRKLLRLVSWLGTYRILLDIARKHEVMGVLSLWYTECALLGRIFSVQKHLPFYVWLQGQDAKKDNPYARLLRLPGSNLLAISEFSCDEVQRNHGVKPLLVVNNGLVPERFPPLKRSSRTIDIIGVGSLNQVKNHALFLDLIKRLQADFPDVRCAIVGEGPLQDELENKCRALGLTDNVRFFGRITHEEVLGAMNDARILLHTSHYEGHSTVMLEALYSGCEVVSTQSIGKDVPPQLYTATEPGRLLEILKILLKKEPAPERFLYHRMEDSARTILGLFESA